ncbi:MAG: pyridoxamine 5'-phosphate oxidase family protein [Acidobacteria bacterium]|nr:pyridoxamine 5'-phosphate oxidase family protein [Acidobacteriota bacterium]
MIIVEEMDNDEIREILNTVKFGHLGCSRDNVPYVVPVNYVYMQPFVYIYTTEGKKVDIIKSNPAVCLQIEQIKDRRHWRSVIFTGTAQALAAGGEREKAIAEIIKTNPTLTPAISVQWMDDWIRENIEVIYRLDPVTVTGRKAIAADPRPRASKKR